MTSSASIADRKELTIAPKFGAMVFAARNVLDSPARLRYNRARNLAKIRARYCFT